MRLFSTVKFTSVSLLLKKGFTLIELLVSIGIMIVITSVALVQHNQFNETLALTNLAYEVGLSVRQAQVFGISVREFDGSSRVGSAEDFLYGVHFEYDPGNRAEYVLYADLNGDQAFTNDTEIVETTTITRGNYVDRFCGIRAGVATCSTGLNSVGALESLSIQFRRPNPDAVIVGRTPSGISSYESAIIVLQSPDGVSERCVRIRPTGQVSIETTCSIP
ncbi:type II secretion system protein [Candidatus Wolfebacteria bacterium]|nr:type II secretion system protein [Candidatus Wolfebacteria bacterium]